MTRAASTSRSGQRGRTDGQAAFRAVAGRTRRPGRIAGGAGRYADAGGDTNGATVASETRGGDQTSAAGAVAAGPATGATISPIRPAAVAPPADDADRGETWALVEA